MTANIIHHHVQPAQIKTRSGIPIRRIISAQEGARGMELWEQELKPGDNIPTHRHDVEESLTFLSGQAQVILGGEILRATARSSVLVPAGVWHSIHNPGGEPVILLAYFPTTDPEVRYP